MGESRTIPTYIFRTEDYRVSRMQMAYLSCEEYIRTFWWYVAIIPAFGLMAVIGGQGNLQVIGYMALVWPFSIPARAILTTTKSAALFAKGAWVGLTQEAILVHGADGKGLKLDYGSVRDAVVRQQHILVRTKRLGFLPIPVSALRDPADEPKMLGWLAERLDVE